MVEIQDVRLPEKSNELRTQDLLDHCNALIEKTTNHTDLGKNKLPKNTEGKKIESQIEDEFFCQNLDQLEIVLERVNENTDIISKTIIEEPLVRTEDGDIKDKQKNEIETMDLLTYSTPKRANRDYYNEPNSKKIKISQNLSIARNDKSKMSQVDEITSSDDELFSDLDVVETTPPKVKRSFFERLSCSQTLTHNPTKLTKLVEIDDDSQLNLDFLPPPPGFEDEDDNEEKSDYVTPTEDIQPVTQKESENIIPNSLSPQGIQMVQIKKPLRMKHSSTPRTLSQEFPGLSPISQVKNTNVIEMAHQSKFSPLTVLPKASPLPSPLTSTPKQKSILSFLEPTKKLSLNNIVDNAQSNVSKPKPCIAYSRLKKEEILGIISLCNRKLATRKDKFEPDVTHMIVSVDKNNKLKDHTMKFVSAVAGGVWVVNYKWVKECLAQNTIVNEEQYEVLDASGIPSPRISRLSREKNPLFQGFKFFIAKPFTQTSVQEIEVAIRLLSGTIASSIEDLVDKDKFICIIIAEVSSTEDLYKCESWLETYKVATVDFHWLSLSISRYRLLSLKPYAICGDDCLEDLGYPSALTEDVPSSLTDDTYNN
ncbi:hypothetical protein HHI36_006262 [Cryptolaemus montrouzieri]|uniref:BRCT domain-containing protein n=1 Tax=Cryptolaemus montrouzieri TaxID=559131 RepID=A0ABD2NX28_9CUCU